MPISVDATTVARVNGAGSFSGSPTVITSASFTAPANSLILMALQAFEANANRLATPGATDNIGGTGWSIVQSNGSAFNGGGANSEGFCAWAWKLITTGGSMTVSGSFSWQDDFSGNPCSIKPIIITGHDLVSPIGATNKGGPTTTGIGVAVNPALTATGPGRFLYVGSEQNGGSGSAGAPTTTDQAPSDMLAYVSTLLGAGVAYKASDHSSGGQTGNFTAAAATFWNWSAIEILAAASAGTNICWVRA